MSSPSSAGAPPAPEKSHPILQSPAAPSIAGPRANSSTLDAANDRSVLATPSWDTKRSFKNADTSPPSASVPADGGNTTVKPTPASTVSGAKSGQELLRRLSLVDGATARIAPDPLPQQAHPSLHLTGRVISATFCIPYKLGFRPNCDDPWVRYCLVSWVFWDLFANGKYSRSLTLAGELPRSLIPSLT